MMVISEANAARERVPCERGDLIGILLPLTGAEKTGALVQWRRAALNAVGHFAIDHDLGAVAGEKLEVRSDGADFVLRRAARKLARVPSRNELQAVLRENLAQGIRLARKLVAELEPLVADGPAFGQRDLERRLAAQRGQVIVAPRDRIDAYLHAEFAGTVSRHGFCCSLSRS